MENSSTLSLVYKSGTDTRNVRLLVRDGEPWWVLADVCAALNLSNPSEVAKRLEPDEVATDTLDSTEGMRGNPTVRVISESGLYSVILGARASDATKKFKRWVTAEVLPQIRRTGSYLAPLEQGDPLTLALQAALDTRQRLSSVESTVTHLEERLDAQPIHGKQRRRIRDLCQQLGRELGDYSKAYRLLWDKFSLASYTDLPSARFGDAERFLLGLIAAYSGQDQLVDA